MKISAKKDKIKESLVFISRQTKISPQIGIILGSGLGDFADRLEDRIKISTKQIPHYPASTVEGHAGFLVFGTLHQKPLLAIQGRAHYYEGYDIAHVAYSVRLMSAMGIRLLIVTNAAGAVNPIFQPGDLMLITDQMNSMYRNPLRGPLSYGGEQFPDMSDPYNREFYPFVEKIAQCEGISLKKGVLLASMGPSYETAAEIRMIRKIGVDAVSMSTIPEVIVAKQEGMKIIGISCITNMATGITDKPLNHDEVRETAQKVHDKFIRLMSGIIREIK
jgi:purine-nucleoside phosphorylase